MIISHAHKFIFLKTKKTASTSIELALSQLCGPDDIITPIHETHEALRAHGRGAQNWQVHSWWQSPRSPLKRAWFTTNAKDYGFYGHMPAPRVRALLNDENMWRSYFKFAFERNPWDRQISWYHYKVRRTVPERRPRFEDHLRTRKARLYNYEIYSINGEVCVDCMGRYETLEEDLRRALAEVGILSHLALPHEKGGFRPKGKHYRDYYTEETRELVGNWYQREIALLGYEF